LFLLPYGTSFTKGESLLRKHRDRRLRGNSPIARDSRVHRKRFVDLMYRLQRDDLVEKDGNQESGRIVRLTQKGRQILAGLRQRKTNALPPRTYPQQGVDGLKIVIFDIPEKEKRKREWLRSVLSRLQFTMLQRSVWSGKTKLPTEFINDLRRLHLFSCVEIFAISKAGTLKKINT
ncbi:MAG TPA: CRISPR-associated endonuclease Cas2, partial [Patescibacteria group bacterium]|nr:CRISPR-associated endonuclease Cas2 [Patescibacteria group bacterium]